MVGEMVAGRQALSALMDGGGAVGDAAATLVAANAGGPYGPEALKGVRLSERF